MRNFFNLQRFVEEYTNSQPKKTLNGTNAADYFENSGSIVKIFGKGGDDTVKNTGNLVTISAGEGDNSVKSFGSNVSITAGGGDDYIENYTSNGSKSKTDTIKIFAGDGDNEIFSDLSTSYVTIVSGKGADSVRSYSDKAKISVGAGNDSVWNGGSYYAMSSDGGDSISVVLGSGDDYFRNFWGIQVTVSGGDGNDIFENDYGDYVTISGGAGNDYFYNGGSYSRCSNYVSMSGGAGDDTVENAYGNYSTITGGAGDDLVSLSSNYSKETILQYTYGDGNDTIYGFNSDDTLYITTSTKFSTVKSGNDLYIMFNNDQVITLKNVNTGVGGVGSKNFVTVKGGNSGGSEEGWKVSGTTATYSNSSGKTLITLSGLKSGLKVKNGSISEITLKNKTVTLAQSVLGSDKAASVKGGGYNYVLSGAGKLTNVGSAATLSGSSGKDTLIGGNGNDKLFGNAGNDSLNGGKGDDTLTAGAGNDTLTGGKGNDIFVHSKGNDVITDYTAGADVIRLNGTTLKSSKVSKKDVILTTDSGTITIKNGKGKDITLIMQFSSSTSALLAEDNFATADNLSSIVENNLSAVSEIETQNLDSLTQENLIVYAAK